SLTPSSRIPDGTEVLSHVSYDDFRIIFCYAKVYPPGLWSNLRMQTKKASFSRAKCKRALCAVFADGGVAFVRPPHIESGGERSAAFNPFQGSMSKRQNVTDDVWEDYFAAAQCPQLGSGILGKLNIVEI